MLYIILVLAGIGIGILITTIVYHKESVGILRIDHSDPDDGPYLFLELSEGVANICERDYVTLEVDVKNYISPK